MNKLFNALVPFILLGAGILFIFLGVTNVKNQKTFIPATAVITDIQTERHGKNNTSTVYVEYTIDGAIYEEQLDSYNAGMKVGKKLNVLYDPADYTHVILKSPMAAIIFFVMGVIATVCGVGTLLKKIRRLA